jgi:hypothetical protein
VPISAHLLPDDQPLAAGYTTDLLATINATTTTTLSIGIFLVFVPLGIHGVSLAALIISKRQAHLLWCEFLPYTTTDLETILLLVVAS